MRIRGLSEERVSVTGTAAVVLPPWGTISTSASYVPGALMEAGLTSSLMLLIWLVKKVLLVGLMVNHLPPSNMRTDVVNGRGSTMEQP
jgi:hypothetical protein